MNNFDEAKSSLETVIHIHRINNFIDMTTVCALRILAKMNHERGNFASAKNYYEVSGSVCFAFVLFPSLMSFMEFINIMISLMVNCYPYES
jgi:hypothetical protein